MIMLKNIPYSRYRDAEELGALYSSEYGCYIIPDSMNIERFDNILPLSIDALPVVNWKSQIVPAIKDSPTFEGAYSTMKMVVRDKASCKCEICGGVGKTYPVAANVCWKLDEESATQIMVGMMALCPDCFRVKNYFSMVNKSSNSMDDLLDHFIKINHYSGGFAQLNRYLDYKTKRIESYAKQTWVCDLQYMYKRIHVDSGMSYDCSREDFEQIVIKFEKFANMSESLLENVDLQRRLGKLTREAYDNNQLPPSSLYYRFQMLVLIMEKRVKEISNV